MDESGFAQDMPRQYGYAPVGSRCYGTHDWHSKGRVNVIGAIVDMTFVTLSLFSSSINSDVFYAWLTDEGQKSPLSSRQPKYPVPICHTKSP